MPKFLDVPQWYNSNGTLLSLWDSLPSAPGGQDPSTPAFLMSNYSGNFSWGRNSINGIKYGDATFYAPMGAGAEGKLLKWTLKEDGPHNPFGWVDSIHSATTLNGPVSSLEINVTTDSGLYLIITPNSMSYTNNALPFLYPVLPFPLSEVFGNSGATQGYYILSPIYLSQSGGGTQYTQYCFGPYGGVGVSNYWSDETLNLKLYAVSSTNKDSISPLYPGQGTQTNFYYVKIL